MEDYKIELCEVPNCEAEATNTEDSFYFCNGCDVRYTDARIRHEMLHRAAARPSAIALARSVKAVRRAIAEADPTRKKALRLIDEVAGDKAWECHPDAMREQPFHLSRSAATGVKMRQDGPGFSDED